jgi:hypothetical protein
VREILSYQPVQRGTNLAVALDFFARVTRRRSAAFLLSDFHATGYERSLRAVARRHDLVALEVRDPLESQTPDVGLVRWQDAETGEIRLAPTGRLLQNSDEVRRQLFHQLRIDVVSLSTSEPYIEPLLGFFRRREKRRRG